MWVNPALLALNADIRGTVGLALRGTDIGGIPGSGTAVARVADKVLATFLPRSVSETVEAGNAAAFGIVSELNVVGGLAKGAFSIRDWTGYPSTVPKPTGPARVLSGAEYDAARAAANNANRAMHAADTSLAGRQIHEVMPVKFGGDPTSIANKVVIDRQEHARVTSWWNALLRQVSK